MTAVHGEHVLHGGRRKRLKDLGHSAGEVHRSPPRRPQAPDQIPSPDVPGQDLRMLGAMVTASALAWQVHVQARGGNNILNGTA
jgi:hypothetical protein